MHPLFQPFFLCVLNDGAYQTGPRVNGQYGAHR